MKALSNEATKINTCIQGNLLLDLKNTQSL